MYNTSTSTSSSENILLLYMINNHVHMTLYVLICTKMIYNTLVVWLGYILHIILLWLTCGLMITNTSHLYTCKVILHLLLVSNGISIRHTLLGQ